MPDQFYVSAMRAVALLQRQPRIARGDTIGSGQRKGDKGSHRGGSVFGRPQQRIPSCIGTNRNRQYRYHPGPFSGPTSRKRGRSGRRHPADDPPIEFGTVIEEFTLVRRAIVIDPRNRWETDRRL
jgi:hypothetical protein